LDVPSLGKAIAVCKSLQNLEKVRQLSNKLEDFFRRWVRMVGTAVRIVIEKRIAADTELL
jgi:hypothetical protein